MNMTQCIRPRQQARNEALLAVYEVSWLLQDFKTNTGHGKLLLDDSLYPEAYATNVNEQVYMPNLQPFRADGDTAQAGWCTAC